MKDLNLLMAREIRSFIISKGDAYRPLDDLTNDLVGDNTNYEHIITFLDASPSDLHRRFAAELRQLFEDVLRRRLAKIELELGNDRFALYAMLLDMYNVKGCPETLQAILTINYDNFIEAATVDLGYSVDFGIGTHEVIASSENSIKLVKLHGSFYWDDTWPISAHIDAKSTTPIWIPPGIEKPKERYPFNLLWGIARELLQCDVLRIVGCNLSGTDWDLISLLFTTRHSNGALTTPYRVEVIDSPRRAREIQASYPYLDVVSILEIEEMGIGAELVSELTEGRHQSVDSMSASELRRVEQLEYNWFLVWLRQMAVSLGQHQHVKSFDTPRGVFREMWEEM